MVHSPLPEGVMRLVLEQAGKVRDGRRCLAALGDTMPRPVPCDTAPLWEGPGLRLHTYHPCRCREAWGNLAQGTHSPLAAGRPQHQVLANDAAGRSQFVHSGGLAAVQQLAEAPGSKLKVRDGLPQQQPSVLHPARTRRIGPWSCACSCSALLRIAAAAC